MTDPVLSGPVDSGSLPDATARLPLGVSPEMAQTQRLPMPPDGNAPIRALKLDHPSLAAGQTQNTLERPSSGNTFRWKLPLALGVLMALSVGAYLVFLRGKDEPPVAVPTAAGTDGIPPGARIYLDQAKSGDAHAMRMLGVMYYYGLNVPQDREKGLYWYRKAAEKGSDVARTELNKLEAGGN